MQVLLKRPVEKLGKCGDVVNVKSGYARNYLLPQDLAVTVTAENIRMLEVEKKKQEEIDKALYSSLEELAEKLNNMSITISAKADGEHLFGSVGPAEIISALADEGITLDKHQIRLEQHLKEVGDYKITIHLYEKLEATLKVWIVSE